MQEVNSLNLLGFKIFENSPKTQNTWGFSGSLNHSKSESYVFFLSNLSPTLKGIK